MLIRRFISILFLPDDVTNAFSRVWGYINHHYEIGNFSVSISSFVTGVAILIVAFLASRGLRSILRRRIAARSNIDPGLQYTIIRLVHYVIVSLGFLYSLKAAFNADLTSLAVVFTALSVGIGFGLQYIAADIASGFILLFERPIRVGDRITIGEDEGDVQSINLRTTIVMTNNRIAVIVPNSKLVSQRLVNWTYSDARTRISIPISVAHGSDVDILRDTLLQSVRGVENVLLDPPPVVQIKKSTDTTLEMSLMVWTARPRVHAQIQSDIYFKIERLLRKNDVKRVLPAITQLQVTNGQPDASGLQSVPVATSTPSDSDGSA